MTTNRRRVSGWARTVLLAVLSLASRSPASAAGPATRQIATDDVAGTSAAVVVDGAAPLVHTEQILPTDPGGAVVAPGRAADQAAFLLDRLGAVLRPAGSGIDRLVKVNVYAANLDALGSFRKAFARHEAGRARPAVSAVVGALPRPDALLAVDAVAVAGPTGADDPRRLRPHVAVLPAGPRVYVSGQAAAGADVAGATRKTLEELDATLKFLKLDRSHVVQVKAFLTPMSSSDAARREVVDFFGGADSAPPVVLVEWTMSAPVEIELVAGGGPEGGKEPLEFLTPPGMTASPVFSRVARVNRGDLIYVAGLYGPPGATGQRQAEHTFETLKTVLSDAGGDFRHLAKATYYVSDDDASRALNDLRPRYYDPSRPPAASKASVAGVGAEGRTLTLDMIAVPVPKVSR